MHTNLLTAGSLLVLCLVLLLIPASALQIQAEGLPALQAKESVEASAFLREELSFGEGEQKNTLRLRANLTLSDEERAREENETGGKEGKNSSLKAHLSNGRFAEIKVMPETASQIALMNLGLHACREENNCTIVLKEVGEGNDTRAAYEVNATKKVRLFGIFKKEMHVKSEISAESGEVVKVHAPWWAFLASEVRASA